MRCNNITKLRGVGKFVYRIRCKWENGINNQESRAEDEGVEIL
jgi:hypothetical protein